MSVFVLHLTKYIHTKNVVTYEPIGRQVNMLKLVGTQARRETSLQTVEEK
jgi:hypothetical protein